MKPYKSLTESNVIAISNTESRRIIDTKHSIDRFLSEPRFGAMAGGEGLRNKVLWVINNAITVIINRYKDQKVQYGVHSKSTGIGLLLDWREDTHDDDGRNHAIIVTMLPIKKKHNFRPEDIVVIVEAQIDMLGRMLLREGGNAVAKKKNMALTVTVNEATNSYITYWQGRLYDHPVEEYIVVE